MGNHDTRRDSSRSCRDVLSKKCLKDTTRLDTIRSEVIRKDLEISENTRCEIQTQTKLDQPSWKNGQHQTSETRPQLQTSRKKSSWTPWGTMATRRCRNRSVGLIYGGRWIIIIIIIIIRNKKEKTCTLIDVAIPADRNVVQKEAEKKLKYNRLYI